MIDLRLKSFAAPDQTIEFPLLKAEIVEVGDFTVGYVVHQPGWSWSEHMRPSVGGEWCQARHVGVVVSGRTGIRLQDGTTYEFGPAMSSTSRRGTTAGSSVTNRRSCSSGPVSTRSPLQH